MSAGDQGHPESVAWVAAVHASPDDYNPLGGGIVIDDRRILTCAHVIENTQEHWVAFPHAADDASATHRKVQTVVFPDARAPVKDLAILVLAAPIPTGVIPAILRCPKPTDLVSKRWWAFGFPPGDPLGLGSSAEGQVGSVLLHGWIRLDKTSNYPVERGFSGGGLWSPDYQAVVAVVSQADDARGDGRAITLHQADQWFPGQKLRILAERYRPTEAGPLALSAWGWSLSGDPQATRHWRPRARGVSIDSERGYRFRGRTAALRAIAAWLDRDTIDRRVLVVTGAPGAGKSAVLGRIVTTADADAVRQLPASDTAIRATLGTVACAVHAKGQTALEIATKIAKAASAALPERIEDFAPALRDALTERKAPRFNVIIDALDESATPAEARLVVSKVILPLAETCADVGAQVVVGSRHSDAEGDLLASFGVAKVVDLDKPEFFAAEDLAAYAHATLQLAGHERTGNPYTADVIATPVATRIAALSDGNFLVAGLTARTHGLYDEVAVDPTTLAFSPKVDDAMREYLERIPDVAGVSAETLLTALAYAEPPGLPISLWRIAAGALGFGDVPESMLAHFARSSGASFLVESSEDDRGAQFRLFHQALNDALLHARATVSAPREDEKALTRSFMAVGRQTGWEHAPAYLLRSLQAHAARADLMDVLLADDDYLLFADLLRVLPLADHATTVPARRHTRLLRLAPRTALTSSAPDRAAMFGVTETLEGLGDSYSMTEVHTPYRAAWASAPRSTEQSVLHGHDGPVSSVCAFTFNGRTHLATASHDHTVRIWDPATGTHQRTLTGHVGQVNDVCAFTFEGSTLIAGASDDHTVRVWDPATGICRRTLTGHGWPVKSVCAFTLDGTTLIASAGNDGTVHIWDPATGTQLRILTGHGHDTSVCAFALDGTTILASADNDWDDRFVNTWTVRIWNPTTGTQQQTLTGHGHWVNSVCAFTLNGRALLASAGDDRTVRIWDPATGAELHTFHGHDDSVLSVCVFNLGGTPRLATGSTDETVRIWDPATGTQRHTLHDHSVRSVCALTLGGTPFLATASDDATVCIRDPVTGTWQRELHGHRGAVKAVCAFNLGGTTLLATGGDDRTARIWDPATGTQLRMLTGHDRPVNAVCALTLGGRTLLATASQDRTIRIWDPATGTQQRMLTGHDWPVNAVCALTLGGTTVLATASNDRTARIWDPATGTQQHALNGHDGPVKSVCALTLGGTTVLATASNDRTARIWDPATEAGVLVIPTRDEASSVAYADGFLFVGTTTGVLAIRLDPEFLDSLR